MERFAALSFVNVPMERLRVENVVGNLPCSGECFASSPSCDKEAVHEQLVSRVITKSVEGELPDVGLVTVFQEPGQLQREERRTTFHPFPDTGGADGIVKPSDGVLLVRPGIPASALVQVAGVLGEVHRATVFSWYDTCAEPGLVGLLDLAPTGVGSATDVPDVHSISSWM